MKCIIVRNIYVRYIKKLDENFRIVIQKLNKLCTMYLLHFRMQVCISDDIKNVFIYFQTALCYKKSFYLMRTKGSFPYR